MFWSDYGLELQSQKVDKWLINQGIIFEPSTPYLQKEINVSESIRRSIIEMVKATILERGINDTFWLEIVLVMTYIKNLQPIWALKNSISPIEI